MDTATITERRVQVRRLCEEGMPVKEIARHLGISRQTVYRHKKVHGLAQAEKQESERRIHKRREQVAWLCGEGLTVYEIAQVLVCSRSTVSRDTKALALRRRCLDCSVDISHRGPPSKRCVKHQKIHWKKDAKVRNACPVRKDKRNNRVRARRSNDPEYRERVRGATRKNTIANKAKIQLGWKKGFGGGA